MLVAEPLSVSVLLLPPAELVHSAREAGISVRTKAQQLWNVGHGLPLDALKKGSITVWSCTYELADGEVKQLFDALKKVRVNTIGGLSILEQESSGGW